MKNLPASAALLLLASFVVQAQTLSDFQEVDTDGNGLLSTEEASAAFPELSIQDFNGDSFLNHPEAEAAIEGLNLRTDGANAVVGAAGYFEMVRASRELERQANAQNGSASEAS